MDKRIVPIIFATFINSVGFSIVIPIAPFIIEEFGGGAFLYGLILSAYAICQFISAPVLGSLSDRYGRKKVLLACNTGTIVSWLIFAVAFSVPNVQLPIMSLPLWTILLARMADGLTGGDNSINNAYVADLTKPEERTRYFGYLSATYGLGLMLGPIIGAYTSNIGFGYMGTIAFSILMLLFAYVVLILFLPSTERNPIIGDKFDLLAELKRSLRYIFSVVRYTNNKVVQSLLYERIIVAFIFVMFTSIFSIYLKDLFHMTSQGIGYVFLIVGLFQVVNQAGIVPLMSKKLGDEKSLMIGSLFIFAFAILVPVYTNIRSFLLVVFFLVLGFSIHFAVLKSLLVKHSPETKKGEVIGIEDSLIAFNQGIVPIVASMLYAHSGSHVFMLSSIPLGLFIIYKMLCLKPGKLV